jgi:hypothetical protein
MGADHLRKWQFQKGVSGNPAGAKKKKMLSQRYAEALELPLPDKDCKRLGLPLGSRIGDGIAKALARNAVRGAVDAAREIADRVEGKAVLRGDLTLPVPPVPPNITIEFVGSQDPLPPPVAAQTSVTITAPAELPPAPASEAVTIPQHCAFCTRPIRLHAVGKRKRWIHTADQEPYCAPNSPSDMRVATPSPAPERNTL